MLGTERRACCSAMLWCGYECGLLQRVQLLPSGLHYTHIHLGEDHLCVPDGMSALWLSGCRSGRHSDRDTDSRLCIALNSACFFHLPPCGSLQSSRCRGYLCHGNRASLPAQTQIPPLVSLSASLMTQQLLQGFSSLPPQPR